MSYNQDIIDFMNGTNKNKKKKNEKINSYVNEKKYQKNLQEEVDDEQGIVIANLEDDENNDEEYNQKPNERSPRLSPTIATLPSPNHMNKSYKNTMIKNLKKSYYETVIEWIDIDQQQIYPTLQSIENLRQRIHHTHQFASLLSDGNNDGDVSFTPISSSNVWNIYGFRHRHVLLRHGQNSTTAETTMASSTLNHDDLQLTIQHNLQHHERMIVQLRHLLSELGDMTNRMSRRYEDLYNGCSSMVDILALPDVLSTMDECHIVYIAFAKELYRKQMLITQIVDIPLSLLPHSNDALNTTNDDNNNIEALGVAENTTEQNPRPIRIVQQCIQAWPYISQQSHIYPYKLFVQEIIERYREPK